MDWLDEIASESILNQAYDWLCERRVNYSPNDDVCAVRLRWAGPVRRFPGGDETTEVCSSPLGRDRAENSAWRAAPAQKASSRYNAKAIRPGAQTGRWGSGVFRVHLDASAQ